MDAIAGIQLRRERYKGWDAWRIEHGSLGLVLVPQVGGRIMGLCWRGHDLAFTMPEMEGRVDDVAGSDVAACKSALGFPLWGGDKTWLGPQPAWDGGTPFVDLDSGAYQTDVLRNDAGGVCVQMASRVCRESGIKVTRTVTMAAGEAGWTVVHRMQNCGDTPATWGVWAVSMVLRPARIYLPRNPRSLYPDGVKAFADEGASEERQAEVVSDMGDVAVIDCTEPGTFKYGVDAHGGWMLGAFDTPVGRVGHVKHMPVVGGTRYAHDCTAEVYNSGAFPYLEMETHGPMTTLAPGDSFEIVERCGLFDLSSLPDSADRVRALVAPFTGGS